MQVSLGGISGKEAVCAWLACCAGMNIARGEAGSYIDRVLSHKGGLAASRCGTLGGWMEEMRAGCME
jgi:hypothetical protein